MTTVGDEFRPLFPGLVLPDSTTLGLQRALPVGPAGGMVRTALLHAKPGQTFADTDWVTVTWDDDQTFAEALPVAGIIDETFTTALSSTWVVKSGAPTVSGGLLHLPNSYPQSQIVSAATHALPGTTVSLLGLVCPAGSSNDASKARGIMLQGVTNPNTNFVQFIKYSVPGLLLARMSPGTSATYTYNATTHANIRIRFVGTTIYFETAPSPGTTWTVLRQVPAPAWVASSNANLMVYGGATSSTYGDGATQTTIDRVTWA